METAIAKSDYATTLRQAKEEIRAFLAGERPGWDASPALCEHLRILCPHRPERPKIYQRLPLRRFAGWLVERFDEGSGALPLAEIYKQWRIGADGMRARQKALSERFGVRYTFDPVSEVYTRQPSE